MSSPVIHALSPSIQNCSVLHVQELTWKVRNALSWLRLREDGAPTTSSDNKLQPGERRDADLICTSQIKARDGLPSELRTKLR